MKILIIVFMVVAVYAKNEKYTGWKTYSVVPTTQEQLQILGLVHSEYELNILSVPAVEREGIILVNPKNQEGFTKFLVDEEISYKVHREDIKAALDYDDELIEATRRENIARKGREMPYDNYQRYGVIMAYMEDIARRFPSTVTLVHPADSFEGRPIKYLKISTTNFQDTHKPIIVVDAGSIAFEWITPPTVTYIIHKLTENVTEPHLLNNFDWILLPVVNPDGYEFTFTDDSFWRMTRSTDQHPSGHICPGVDANRNFDFVWNTVGVGVNPCNTAAYPGSRPFSEIETRVVRDILHEHLPRIALYLSMHSFGSLILYPYGHDGTLSNTALALHLVGISMADAVHANQLPHFVRYRVGNAFLVRFYGESGRSEDYAHYIGVPLVYNYDLPSYTMAAVGFHFAPRYIEQVAKDTWEGVAVGARMAGEIFNMPSNS